MSPTLKQSCFLLMAFASTTLVAADWTTVLENFADDSLDFSGEGVSPKDELRLTWRYVDLSKKGLCLIFR